MADPDARLAAGLAAIAEHGRRTGSLASAADIRQRGDRRRAHRRTLLVAAGTLGAVLAVAGLMTAAMTIGTHVNLGQWYLPAAMRKGVIDGMLIAPAPVFWNMTKTGD